MTVLPSISRVTLLVNDYDAAIDYFVSALGLQLRLDEPIDDGERFVVVGGAPNGADVQLARAATAEEQALVGRQTAGRVGFFLQISDFETQYRRMAEAGVLFHEAPRHEVYGTVAVFSDLCGNRWDLVEPSPSSRSA